MKPCQRDRGSAESQLVWCLKHFKESSEVTEESKLTSLHWHLLPSCDTPQYRSEQSYFMSCDWKSNIAYISGMSCITVIKSAVRGFISNFLGLFCFGPNYISIFMIESLFIHYNQGKINVWISKMSLLCVFLFNWSRHRNGLSSIFLSCWYLRLHQRSERESRIQVSQCCFSQWKRKEKQTWPVEVRMKTALNYWPFLTKDMMPLKPLKGLGLRHWWKQYLRVINQPVTILNTNSLSLGDSVLIDSVLMADV